VSIAALIVGAGRGVRAGGGVPKQYATLGQHAVIAHSLAAFESLAAITTIQAVIHSDDSDLYTHSIATVATGKCRPPVTGGVTRQASVFAGLQALDAVRPEYVLIHDAARPFLTPDLVGRVIASLQGGATAALAGVRVADTLKRADNNGHVTGTIDRANMWQAQTPQGFRFDAIFSAHAKAAAENRHDFTDDAALAEWAGVSVQLVEGASSNGKITTADDLHRANEAMRMAVSAMMEPRIGTGFDVHRFTTGSSVWLCGVEIPHDAKLDGHSDADVGLHALTDAILGALGDGDIGQHFPPSDPKWKGAASTLFLADAVRRVAERGGKIINADVTLLCEAPRIGPHRPRMQAVIAGVLRLDPARVGIKATTTEGLGFTGRREGIAAMANALIMLPISV
jgi:2-C-methyl-D-erythritol 4-phosphate cytidylyltransferase / 2-C-methyl-D-erythritol 2,4-cyclodiphosphate synthase